jgi:hypothetical protein
MPKQEVHSDFPALRRRQSSGIRRLKLFWATSDPILKKKKKKKAVYFLSLNERGQTLWLARRKQGVKGRSASHPRLELKEKRLVP